MRCEASTSQGQRAALYARVSTEMQAKKGLSIEGQIERGHERARADGKTVAPHLVFKDVLSGARTDRPDYQRMLEAARNGHFDTLYVWKFDRLGRDAIELLRARRELESLGVRVVSLTEGDSENEFVYGVHALVAADLRQKIADNTRRGARDRVASGKCPGSTAVYGCRRGADGQWEHDPDEKPIAIEMCDSYASGESQLGIAQQLNARGIRTRKGREWDQNAVRRVLVNPALIGKHLYGGELFDCKHPPLIDMDTWERIQARMGTRSEPNEQGGRTKKPRLFVKPLRLFCDCGLPFVARSGMYVCKSVRLYGADATCRNAKPGIPGGPVDLAAIDLVLRVGHDYEAFRADLEQSVGVEVAKVRAERERAERDAMRAHALRNDVQHEWEKPEDERPSLKMVETLQAKYVSEASAAEAKAAQLRRRECELEEAVPAFDLDAEMARQVAGYRAAAVEPARALAEPARVEQSAVKLRALGTLLRNLFDGFELRNADFDRWVGEDGKPLDVEAEFPGMGVRAGERSYLLVPRVRASVREAFEALQAFPRLALPVSPMGQETPVPPSPQYPAGFFARYCWWYGSA